MSIRTLARKIWWRRLYRGSSADLRNRVITRSPRLERIGPIRLPLAVLGHSEPVNFTAYYYGSYTTGADFIVFSLRDSENWNEPLVRISSSCIWGLVLGSVRCDCRWEFEEAKRLAAEEPDGNAVVIYSASAHGKGVPGGIRGHAMVYAAGQAAGDDLVFGAYLRNGLELDYRSYDDEAAILSTHGIKSMRLLTNSPDRLATFRNRGFQVTHVPIEKPYEPWDAEELGVKRARFAHMLDLPGFQPVDVARYGLDPANVFDSPGGVVDGEKKPKS